MLLLGARAPKIFLVRMESPRIGSFFSHNKLSICSKIKNISMSSVFIHMVHCILNLNKPLLPYPVSVDYENPSKLVCLFDYTV